MVKVFYFNSTRSGAEQVYYMSLEGGDPIQITNYVLGVSSPKLSSDGNKFLFSAMVYPECGADADCNQKNFFVIRKRSDTSSLS